MDFPEVAASKRTFEAITIFDQYSINTFPVYCSCLLVILNRRSCYVAHVAARHTTCFRQASNLVLA
jgi:hypothetical protein